MADGNHEPRLRSITLLRDRVPDGEVYPFAIPVIRSLSDIKFKSRVCFFVGENGSGKSTLLEAIAENVGFNREGGGRNFRYCPKSVLPLIKSQPSSLFVGRNSNLLAVYLSNRAPAFRHMNFAEVFLIQLQLLGACKSKYLKMQRGHHNSDQFLYGDLLCVRVNFFELSKRHVEVKRSRAKRGLIRVYRAKVRTLHMGEPTSKKSLYIRCLILGFRHNSASPAVG